MFDIITYLLYFIQIQNNIILYLIFSLDAIKASKQPDEPVDKPYRKLKVDDNNGGRGQFKCKVCKSTFNR